MNIETSYREKQPCCGSCGWLPAFYELDFDREETLDTDTHIVYHAPCVGDDEFRFDHRGHYLYIERNK